MFVFFPDIWWFQVEFSLNQSNKYSGIVWEWPPRMGLEWLKYVMLRSGDIRINHGGMYQKSGCSIIIIRTRMRPAKIEGTRILAYPLIIKHGWLENPPFMVDFPSSTSIFEGFSIALFDYRRVTKILPTRGRQVTFLVFVVAMLWPNHQTDMICSWLFPNPGDETIIFPLEMAINWSQISIFPESHHFFRCGFNL